MLPVSSTSLAHNHYNNRESVTLPCSLSKQSFAPQIFDSIDLDILIKNIEGEK